MKVICDNCETEQPEYFYIDSDNNILGCSKCITKVDAAQWAYDHEPRDDDQKYDEWKDNQL